MIESDCIFCKIVSGEVPAEKVYENERFLAFADANPVGEGHTLVIPKKHFETILNLDDETSEGYLKFVKKVAKKLLKKYRAEGFNITVNNGKVAGQRVPHLHFHILPRKKGDGHKGFYLG
ncbi:MAG: HIT domain-containing protein [Candidatus Pacearchaeota archaeon]